ncbi:MAG: helicase, partial [bacterium]|nr:helicase [bacterium]
MDAKLLEFLGVVERAECSLLAWGLVDGHLPAAEIGARAAAFLDERNGWGEYADETVFLDELVNRRLLFRWYDGGYRYRSRMAETVRLMARLRQLFPRHLAVPGEWVRSPTLVADFRFQLRAREYPRRDVPAIRAIAEEFSRATRLSPLQQDALRAMLGVGVDDPGSPLAGFQIRATNRILGQAGGSIPSGTVVCAGTGSGKTW